MGTSSRRLGWSLRTRLVVGLVGLLAAVSLVVGVATEVALHDFLVGRLDDQLTAAVTRSQDALGQPSDNRAGQLRSSNGATNGATNGVPNGVPDGVPGFHPAFLLPPGQSAGTLGARLTAGVVSDAGIISDDGSLAPLDAGAAAALTTVPADEHPHTQTIGGNGEFRLIARQMPDGTVLVTGLPLRPIQATLSQLAVVGAAVAGIGLLAAAFAGTAIVRLTLRPLRRVATTARRVAQLPLDRGEVALAERVPEADTDPRTEVGQVGAALNSMLGHVGAALAARQASEMKVRQFVADASHELRTPLAAIRGYAELTRRGRDRVPPDIAHALSRVESEATRMTSLVEDLLLLARLDAGRPLDTEAVDLSRLVVDTVSDAHAAGPHHRWQLELPDEPVIVTGDTARLHQVLANLLANARTHTPPGTTVTASLHARSPGLAVLAVLDDGPGIPPDLLPSVFERFARGDGSRSRAAGSTGLGLAIVSAVVTAHHGTVDVTSRPGQTAFIVRLPTHVPAMVPGPAMPAGDAMPAGVPMPAEAPMPGRQPTPRLTSAPRAETGSQERHSFGTRGRQVPDRL